MTLLKEQHFKHDTPDAWITAWPLPGRILSRGWCIFLQLRLFALLLHSLRVLLNDCIEGFRLLKPHQIPTPEKLPLVVSQDIVPVVLLPAVSFAACSIRCTFTRWAAAQGISCPGSPASRPPCARWRVSRRAICSWESFPTKCC